jgi:ADP-ribosyl-[dinitrogen reductase] hydrolase
MSDDSRRPLNERSVAKRSRAPVPEARLAGCLLGCAVGDAIGLPYAGMSTQRAKRFAKLPLTHRFAFGRGMVSDDTDHTVFVLQALLVSEGNTASFRRALAWRLRWWLACLPAGIGYATLRATLRLWLGMSRSGVYSAGNGAAMRSAVIGAVAADDAPLRHELVRISTELTHTDPRALAGALAVAEVAARLASETWRERPALDEWIAALRAVSSEHDWAVAIDRVREACKSPTKAAAITKAESCFSNRNGVSGFVLHSVPFALVVWYVHFGDYRATIEAITQVGGDVDTVGAIAGALAGIAVTDTGIPSEWVNGITDWPHSVVYLRTLACEAASGQHRNTTIRFQAGLLPRGVVFTALVLAHGLRRLFPPYR